MKPAVHYLTNFGLNPDNTQTNNKIKFFGICRSQLGSPLSGGNNPVGEIGKKYYAVDLCVPVAMQVEYNYLAYRQLHFDGIGSD